MAAPVSSAPGRALQIKPCTPDPADSCWDKAGEITRFAAPERVGAAPVSASVRLARQGQSLLVQGGALPEGATIELIMGKNRTGGLAQAAALVVGEGIHQMNLGPGHLDGRIRSLSVHLRESDAGIVRTWAPHGHGDLNRPGAAWFSSATTARLISIEQTDEGLSLHAPKAVELRVAHRRPILPVGGRGISKPWSIQGKHTLNQVQPPQSGWHDVTALWRGPGGGVTHMIHRVLYLRAPGAPEAEQLGIHPAPQRFTAAQAEGFQVRDGTRVLSLIHI